MRFHIVCVVLTTISVLLIDSCKSSSRRASYDAARQSDQDRLPKYSPNDDQARTFQNSQVSEQDQDTSGTQVQENEFVEPDLPEHSDFLAACEDYDNLDPQKRHTIKVLKFQQTADCKTHFASLYAKKTIQLNGKKLTNLFSMGELSKLESIYAAYNDIKELVELEKLKNLKILDISHNQVTDLKPLGELSKLSYLNLSYNTSIESMYPVKTLKNLTHLYVSRLGSTHWDVIGELSQLKVLHANASFQTDVSYMETLHNLKRLYLSSNNITDVSKIFALTKLEHLNLADNQIVDIEGIQQLVNLTVLDLSNNPLINIEQIKELKQLKELSLSGASLIDLSFLPNQTLKVLRLQDCQIENYRELLAFENLEELDLKGCAKRTTDYEEQVIRRNNENVRLFF